MKHTETHMVTLKNGPRPAGPPDKCFYCGMDIGEEHAVECVCRTRSVVMRHEFEVTVDVPDSWSAEDIEFHYNQSSWCAGDAIAEIERHGDCLCGIFTSKYLREATENDEARLRNG